MVDPVAVAAVVGVVPAVVSVLYTKLSVDEMRRQNEQTRRSQLYLTSHDLMKTVHGARQEWVRRFRLDPDDVDRLPPLKEAIEVAGGNLETVFVVRNYVEQLQEAYFARKHDLMTDDHWRAMHRVVRGFLNPTQGRRYFDLFCAAGYLTDEFEAFVRDYRTTSTWKDPLRRLPAAPDPQVRAPPSA